MACLSYDELVLGLTVNADTYDEEEEALALPTDRSGAVHGAAVQEMPFDCSQLGRFDYRLGPCSLYPSYETERHSTNILELDEIQSWWTKSLALSLPRQSEVEKRFRMDPFRERGARKLAEDFAEEHSTSLQALRALGIELRPVAVDGDGSCLAHAISTALVGSQMYFDALRFGIYKELRDHKNHYLRVGAVDEPLRRRFASRLEADSHMARTMGLRDRMVVADAAVEALEKLAGDYGGPLYTEQEFDRALERSRPCEGERVGQDRFLEEIHLSALSNLLRRPIWVFADACRIFLPLRHDPEATRLPNGQFPRPLVLALYMSHYAPCCLALEEDYWAWLTNELFPGDAAVEETFRMYREALEFRSGRQTIPEWAEDVLYYVIRKAWEAVCLTLDEFDVAETDRATFLQKFGRPRELLEVGEWMFEGLEEQELAATFRSDPVLLAVYRCLGLTVTPVDYRDDYVKLRCAPHMLDIETIQKMILALYAFRSLPLCSSALKDAGIVPIEGRVDMSLCKISNGVSHERADWGIAHLYCEPEGWVFASCSSLSATDPTEFMTTELTRLKQKFTRLTGLDFDVQRNRDMAEHLSRRRSDDVRGQVPKAYLAMQKVLCNKPYPGRGRCHASHVVLLKFPTIKGPQDMRLNELPLDTREHRQYALAVLASHYGLPLNAAFESAAASVFLFETHSVSRTRAKVMSWLCEAARGLHNVRVDTEGHKAFDSTVVTQMLVSPLKTARPLPAFSVFSPDIASHTNGSAAASYAVQPRSYPEDDDESDALIPYRALKKTNGNGVGPSLERSEFLHDSHMDQDVNGSSSAAVPSTAPSSSASAELPSAF